MNHGTGHWVNAYVLMMHRFNGRLFSIGAAEALPKNVLGMTTSRDESFPAIVFDHRLGGEQALEVCIHEALHAFFDDRLDEETVEKAGKDISGFLWRLGYRLDDKKKRRGYPDTVKKLTKKRRAAK